MAQIKPNQQQLEQGDAARAVDKPQDGSRNSFKPDPRIANFFKGIAKSSSAAQVKSNQQQPEQVDVAEGQPQASSGSSNSIKPSAADPRTAKFFKGLQTANRSVVNAAKITKGRTKKYHATAVSNHAPAQASTSIGNDVAGISEVEAVELEGDSESDAYSDAHDDESLARPASASDDDDESDYDSESDESNVDDSESDESNEDDSDDRAECSSGSHDSEDESECSSGLDSDDSDDSEPVVIACDSKLSASAFLGNHRQSRRPEKFPNAAKLQQARDSKPKPTSGRRGRTNTAATFKASILNEPMVQALTSLNADCHQFCSCDRKCTSRVGWREIMQERLDFFGGPNDAAPKDNERARRLFSTLTTRGSESQPGKLCIAVGGTKVCAAGYLRILGLLRSPDMNKAPRQARRMIRGRLQNLTSEELFAKTKVKLGRNETYTDVRGTMAAYIEKQAVFFSDTFPAVTSKDGSTETRQLPFKTKKDLYHHWECEAISLDEYVGSYQTFCRAFKGMKDKGLVKLLGGKGGFNTCSVCNNCLAMKKNQQRRKTAKQCK